MVNLVVGKEDFGNKNIVAISVLRTNYVQKLLVMFLASAIFSRAITESSNLEVTDKTLCLRRGERE